MTKKLKQKGLKIKRIGIAIKPNNTDATAFALEIGKFIYSKGLEAVFTDEGAATAKSLAKIIEREVPVVRKNRFGDSADLIVVLGGDGTFLGIARLMQGRSTPIMGVNMGQLGFLTEIKKSEAIETLGQLIRGKAPVISERALLDVTLKRRGKTILRGPAVNDVVISKGANARIIGLQVTVDGQWVNDMRADGVIISTPTGSSAYSLAAGGPIIEPTVQAFVMTAICPHSLTQRPLVISDQSEIEICLKDHPGHVLMTLDGQDFVDMNEGDTITIRRYEKHSLKLISSSTRDYFSLLREKLSFGMRS